MERASAADLIRLLRLERHPEGGWFRRTYEGVDRLPAECLPPRFGGERPIATAILYLLEGCDFSAFHRLKSDEMWHFYEGSSLTLYTLQEGGTLNAATLGRNVHGGERFQAVVPAGCWFAARVNDPEGFALVGCTVAPGFDYTDFEMADREALATRYPQHRKIIESLTQA